MDENPYKSSSVDMAELPRRRWPWVIVLALAGPLLGLVALRYYQATNYGAGEETFNRASILGAALAAVVIWSAYRLVRA
jgi:hypothetical protein